MEFDDDRLPILQRAFRSFSFHGISVTSNHHHHHHVAIKELGHLLTRSGLTHPEVSSVVFLGSFCLLGCNCLSIWVICYVAICMLYPISLVALYFV
jgi:hypothetical protein